MDYLAENAKKDGVTVTESGLQYRVIEEGTGRKAEHPVVLLARAYGLEVA